MRGEMYRGVVTRATAAGVWFKIASRWPGVEFGPCPLLATPIPVPTQTTSSTSVADHGGHTHTVASSTRKPDRIVAGDKILIADTGREDFVVLGVIQQGVS